MPFICDIAEIKRKVGRWAANLKFDVKSVFLFGSRAKGTSKSDSDIDIAIEFLERMPTIEWMDNHQRWENHLSKILCGRVHLELYDQEDAPSLTRFVSDPTTIVLYP